MTLYLIQHAAGSYKSWELHRLEERLWDFPAVILRHPRQSGGLSHISPSICERRRKKKKQGVSQDEPGLFGVNLSVSIYLFIFFINHASQFAATSCFCDTEHKLPTSHQLVWVYSESFSRVKTIQTITTNH